ncbi:MAG: PKD-like domain-containing protein, partial [Saprospiraceae bacterium]|nr:PKD-like domain-containing protein [Saprospiraceae bacterium]
SHSSIPAGGGGGGGFVQGGGGGGGSAGTTGCSGNDKGGGGGGAGGSSFTGGLLGASTSNGIWAGNGSVILMFNGPCISERVCATVDVKPTPDAIATPSNQTICSGNAITTIVLSGGVPNTTFNWTRNNVATVTGIAADGSGDISGSLTNTTNAPIIVTFTITASADGCLGTPITATVLVNPTPNAVATPAAQTICSGNAITTIVLSGNVAGTGFNWTRDNVATVNGIAANGAGDISGMLTNTTNAPITVTFTITPTANGCPGTPITATVLVNPTPNAVATPAAQTICSGNAITTIVLSGNVAGTSYTWSRNNVASVTGIAANGTGNISGTLTNTTNAPITVTFTITPTATNCPGTAITATVLVNPTPAAFAVTGGGQVCNTDNIGVPVGLSGSQTNVNYQLRLNGVNTGAPVAGTGAAISFGPQLGIGTYTVVATHTQGACTNNMTGSVTITAFNCNIEISDPCVCLNNATTLTNGQFGETIKVNAPNGQVWTVTAINGLFSQFSPLPPSNPFPIAVGTNLIMLGGNMYTLTGIHIDALGYTVTVSNGRGTILSIGNSCQYPNPSIATVFPSEVCLNSDPIPLVGNPGDANIVSQTFRVNGVVTNVFDPAQGVGQYTILYTVNGGVPKAFGPNDPGCIQSVSTIVNVVATPSNLNCNNQVYVSLDASCTKAIGADDVLEGSFFCYDDYIVDVDKTLPLGNGPWVPAVFNASDIGKNYQVRVTHLVSGITCWGNLQVEDKLAPALVCENFEIPCNTPNLTPNYLVNTLG